MVTIFLAPISMIAPCSTYHDITKTCICWVTQTKKWSSSYIEKSSRSTLNPILINSSQLGVSPYKGNNKTKAKSSTSNDHDLSKNSNVEVKDEAIIDVF